MTFAEIERAVESKARVEKKKQQEKATFDYILADLIGKSMARVYSSSNKLPSINEAYPNLFNSEEIKEKVQENKNTLSVLRFKEFAQSFNTRFKGASIDNERTIKNSN